MARMTKRQYQNARLHLSDMVAELLGQFRQGLGGSGERSPRMTIQQAKRVQKDRKRKGYSSPRADWVLANYTQN